VEAFETLERDHAEGPLSGAAAGTFEVTPTKRSSDDGSDAGGGLMSVMRGGAGVRESRRQCIDCFRHIGRAGAGRHGGAQGHPGMTEDPRFWASGISLVAHMQNPHAPAVHMNTRMFWTPHASWFGGGSDLNPCIEYAEDTAHFHAVKKRIWTRTGAIFTRV